MEKASLGSEQCHKVGGTLPLHKSPPVISTTGVWGRASRHAAAPAASDSLPFLPFLAPVSSVPDVQFKPICVEKLLRYFPTFEQFPFHQKSSTVASSFPGQVLLPLNPPAQAQPEGFDPASPLPQQCKHEVLKIDLPREPPRDRREYA